MTKVWEMGVTGKGVVVSIIDDGIQSESEDIRDNFVSFGVFW